jgi:hypothetical protein
VPVVISGLEDLSKSYLRQTVGVSEERWCGFHLQEPEETRKGSGLT